MADRRAVVVSFIVGVVAITCLVFWWAFFGRWRNNHESFETCSGDSKTFSRVRIYGTRPGMFTLHVNDNGANRSAACLFRTLKSGRRFRASSHPNVVFEFTDSQLKQGSTDRYKMLYTPNTIELRRFSWVDITLLDADTATQSITTTVGPESKGSVDMGSSDSSGADTTTPSITKSLVETKALEETTTSSESMDRPAMIAAAAKRPTNPGLELPSDTGSEQSKAAFPPRYVQPQFPDLAKLADSNGYALAKQYNVPLLIPYPLYDPGYGMQEPLPQLTYKTVPKGKVSITLHIKRFKDVDCMYVMMRNIAWFSEAFTRDLRCGRHILHPTASIAVQMKPGWKGTLKYEAHDPFNWNYGGKGPLPVYAAEFDKTTRVFSFKMDSPHRGIGPTAELNRDTWAKTCKSTTAWSDQFGVSDVADNPNVYRQLFDRMEDLSWLEGVKSASVTLSCAEPSLQYGRMDVPLDVVLDETDISNNVPCLNSFVNVILPDPDKADAYMIRDTCDPVFFSSGPVVLDKAYNSCVKETDSGLWTGYDDTHRAIVIYGHVRTNLGKRYHRFAPLRIKDDNKFNNSVAALRCGNETQRKWTIANFL